MSRIAPQGARIFLSALPEARRFRLHCYGNHVRKCKLEFVWKSPGGKPRRAFACLTRNGTQSRKRYPLGVYQSPALLIAPGFVFVASTRSNWLWPDRERTFWPNEPRRTWAISLLFPCSACFFRQKSRLCLIFLQIFQIARPPLQGSTGDPLNSSAPDEWHQVGLYGHE
jgi:hypothetical protein